MVTIDPHGHSKTYQNWKDNGGEINYVSDETAQWIRQYIFDMELGRNIAPGSKKGARSPGRLVNLIAKLQTILSRMEEFIPGMSMETLSSNEIQVMQFFNKMRKGEIKCRNNKGKPIKATGTYVKTFKSFWHWFQRVKKQQGVNIADITEELDGSDEKPKFTYLTFEEVKRLCDNATFEYRTLILFAFCSGIRAPKELMNVRAGDLHFLKEKNCYQLHIREEISKTFGRKIKLLLCSEQLEKYLQQKGFKSDDYLFTVNYKNVNEYIKNLGYRVLGIGKLEEKKYSSGRKKKAIVDGLGLYDFRHSSACYWTPLYKNESALKYRFGWKKSEMITYYTHFMGMKDNIEEDDLYVDTTKTQLEQDLEKQKKKNELMEEQIQDYNTRMQRLEKEHEIMHEILLKMANAQGAKDPEEKAYQASKDEMTKDPELLEKINQLGSMQ